MWNKNQRCQLENAMNYISGEKVQIGDHVLIENGRTQGIVSEIVETQQEMYESGVDEAGLSIKAPGFGLVFWPATEIDDPVIFVKRGSD